MTTSSLSGWRRRRAKSSSSCSSSSTSNRPPAVGRPMLAPEVPLVLHAGYTRTDVLAALGSARRQSLRPHGRGSRRRRTAATTPSSSTSRRPSATTRRRPCTGTTRSTASCSTGSRSRPRLPSSPACDGGSSISSEAGNVLLFVRDKKRSELGTQPFTFLGPVTYVDHRGERPVAFTWRSPGPDARGALRGRTERRGRVARPSPTVS